MTVQKDGFFHYLYPSMKRLPPETERALNLTFDDQQKRAFYLTPFENIYLTAHAEKDGFWVLINDIPGKLDSITINEYLLLHNPEIVGQIIREFDEEIKVKNPNTHLLN